MYDTPRDPNRIPVMLEKLRLAWETNPDLRLSQLIMNCQPLTGLLYQMEDDVLADRLTDLYLREKDERA